MSTQNKEIITIAGRPGSGKSTAAKSIASILGFTHFSSGDLFREVSKEHGQTVLLANQAAEQSEGISEIDQLVDQRLRDIGISESKIVIDSRMAWHWMPQSFRVFLDLDTKTAAQRILSDMSPQRIAGEHIPDDPEEYTAQLDERLASESRRYRRMYDVDPYDTTNYDLVVDTKVHGKDAVTKLIIDQYQKWVV